MKVKELESISTSVPVSGYTQVEINGNVVKNGILVYGESNTSVDNSVHSITFDGGSYSSGSKNFIYSIYNSGGRLYASSVDNGVPILYISGDGDIYVNKYI